MKEDGTDANCLVFDLLNHDHLPNPPLFPYPLFRLESSRNRDRDWAVGLPLSYFNARNFKKLRGRVGGRTFDELFQRSVVNLENMELQ